MTRDPIIDKSRGPTGSGFFEDLAVNNTYSDIPTLIEYLKSEKVLSKTALKNNISPIALRNQINITVPREELKSYLPSILQVNLIGPDKLKLNKLARDLSKDYINTAKETKQEKLKDGIDFLKNERPTLEKRSAKLQDDLEEFRLVNKLINPLKESENLKSKIETIKSEILILESENIRLLFIKDNLLWHLIYRGHYKQK